MSDVAVKTEPGINRESLSAEQATETVVPQIQLPEAKVQEIVDWITGEINTALGERSGLEDNLAEWERLYEARPKVGIV